MSITNETSLGDTSTIGSNALIKKPDHSKKSISKSHEMSLGDIDTIGSNVLMVMKSGRSKKKSVSESQGVELQPGRSTRLKSRAT